MVVATPICRLLGMKSMFEDAKFKQKSELNEAQTRLIKREQSPKRLLKKATETLWKSVFYAFMWMTGTFVVLLNSDWGLDNSKWMIDFVSHEFTWDMKFYYQVELCFYLSLLISQFYDHKRRDFYPMFIHHVTTIILLFASYNNSLSRFGVVIIYLHDC